MYESDQGSVSTTQMTTTGPFATPTTFYGYLPSYATAPPGHQPFMYPPPAVASAMPISQMPMGSAPANASVTSLPLGAGSNTYDHSTLYQQAYLQNQFMGIPPHIQTASRSFMDKPPQRDKDGKFVCPECSRTYNHGKHLKRHMLRHTGERPYMCEYCPAAFTRTDICKRHKQKCKFARNPQPRPRSPALGYYQKPVYRQISGGVNTLPSYYTDVAGGASAMGHPQGKKDSSLSPASSNTYQQPPGSAPTHYSPQMAYTNGRAQQTSPVGRGDGVRSNSTPPMSQPLPNTQFVLGYPTPAIGNGPTSSRVRTPSGSAVTPALTANNTASTSPVDQMHYPHSFVYPGNASSTTSGASAPNAYGLGIYFQKQ